MPITHATQSAVTDAEVEGEIGPSEWNEAHTLPAHDELSGLSDDDHPQYLKEKASGGVASELPEHDHTGSSEGGLISSTDHGGLAGLTDDDHTQYIKEKASGGVASEVPEHTHASSGEAGTVAHSDLTGLTSGDPHTQYRLEAEDHTHQSTGAQAGKLDHGAALNGLSDDDHPQYALWAALQASQLVNEIINFPSMEGADGAQPEWWEEADGNATLTEEDVAGESITETWERALKVVVASANSYAYQRYTYADQPRLKSGRVVSAIVAVWSVSSVNARVRLQSSVGSLGVSSTTTTAGWTILTVEGVTLDGTYVDLRLEVDVGTAYFVPLGLNIGARAVPLPPRPLVFRARTGTSLVSLTGAADPDTWTDIDCTTATSPLACIALCNGRLNEATSTYVLGARRNGSSEALDTDINAVVIVDSNSTRGHNQFTIILDDQQIFEYILNRSSGVSDLDFGAISLLGWWEWG